MPNIHQKQSKRVSCRQRYKVEKKVKQHLKKKRREARKEAKRNPNRYKPKDPGVPNSLPFKETVLKEAQACKEMQERLRKELREQQKAERQERFMKNRSLGDVRQDAERRGDQYEGMRILVDHLEKTGQMEKFRDQLQFRCYYSEFRKVVEEADVVLEVVDARDPLGTRSPQLEQLVLAKGKRLVLVLNKADLIPKENLEKWLKYLRNELPAVGFKASTQMQKNKLSRSWAVNVTKASEAMQQSSRCLGANVLAKLLANYCRNRRIKKHITVGVVGYPNVGKSSIINSFKRMRSCSVGAIPGLTRVMQRVQIDQKVMLLDSPGVVLAKDTSEATAALRNAKVPGNIRDPIGPACSILRRSSKEQFRIHYKLPDFSTPEECFNLLAKRMGLLKKGGVPNPIRAAMRIIIDWNTGRIKYYTHPPETHEMPAHLSAEIVATMSAEFDLNSLEAEEEEELKAIHAVRPSNAVEMKTMGTVDIDLEGDNSSDGEDGMETEGADEKMTVQLSPKKEKKPTGAKVAKKKSEKSPLESLQQNRARRLEFRKMLRKRRKNEKLAASLSSSLESAFSTLGRRAADDKGPDGSLEV